MYTLEDLKNYCRRCKKISELESKKYYILKNKKLLVEAYCKKCQTKNKFILEIEDMINICNSEE